jgi:DNA polymerase-3 subunit delta'
MASHKQLMDEIIGHDKQINFLQKQIKFGKINHAYLFVGPKNLGKTRVANFFIKSLYCLADNKPCSKCVNCKQIIKRIHPDIFYVEPSEKGIITVSQAREIRRNLAKKAWNNNWKVVCVSDAHALNGQAANALLKTLEEPAKKQIIILIAEKISVIPATILSRCQILKFLPVNKKSIDNYLYDKVDTKEERELISALANGFPEIAKKNLTNKKNLKKYQDTVYKTLYFFKTKSLRAKIEELDVLAKKSDSIKQFLPIWILLWRDMLLLKNNKNNFVINAFAIKELLAISEKYTLEKILQVICDLNEITESKQNKNLKLSLENIIINNF